MTGIVSGISNIAGGVIARRSAKRAQNAQIDALNRATDRQDAGFSYAEDLVNNAQKLNLRDLVRDRDASINQYTDAYGDVRDTLQDGFDDARVYENKGYKDAMNQLNTGYNQYANTQNLNSQELQNLAQTQYRDLSSIANQSKDQQIASIRQGTGDAIKTQLNALNSALKQSKQAFDYTSQKLMPFYNEGVKAFNQYASEAGDNFEFKYEESPGYQFLKDETLRSTTNQAAARGMGLSGANLKALNRDAVGLAQQDYTNEYNRAYTERNDRLNRLGSLGELGLRTGEYLSNENADQQRRNIEIGNTFANNVSGYQDALGRNVAGVIDATNTNIGNARNNMGVNVANAANARNNNIATAQNALSTNLSNLQLGQGTRYGDQERSLANSLSNLDLQRAGKLSEVRDVYGANINNQRNNTANFLADTKLRVNDKVASNYISEGDVRANYQYARGQALGQIWNGALQLGASAAGAGIGAGGGMGMSGGGAGAIQGLNWANTGFNTNQQGQSYVPQMVRLSDNSNSGFTPPSNTIYAQQLPMLQQQQSSLFGNAGGSPYQLPNGLGRF